MIKFQDNRQMSGGKDGQTLFHRIPPATARGPTSTTVVYWHLKVKNKMCNVGLIKNYSIKVSMQKISSIHKLIQQILGSHELNNHTHFWPGPPKNHWNNFLLSWICTTMQKICSFYVFTLEIQPILESCDQTGYTHFWPHPSKKFSVYSKNPGFGPLLAHFPNFGGKKNFSGKSGSVTHNFIWVSSTMPKFWKNCYNSKKTPRQMKGRKDGQTLFHRTLPANAGGPINLVAIQQLTFMKLRGSPSSFAFNINRI